MCKQGDEIMSNVHKATSVHNEQIIQLLFKAFSNLYTMMGVEMSPSTCGPSARASQQIDMCDVTDL